MPTAIGLCVDAHTLRTESSLKLVLNSARQCSSRAASSKFDPPDEIDKLHSIALRCRIQHSCEIPIPKYEPEFQDLSYLVRMALSRWENEGGAGCDHLDSASTPGPSQPDVPPLTNAELVQLQIRVIALENLVIALLTAATDRQLDMARDIPAYISPRPGFTPHRLTIHAAAEMTSLVKRAGHFKAKPPS